MFLVISAGFVLSVTPFVANFLVPVPDKQLRMSKQDQLKLALGRWFHTDGERFVDVQGVERLIDGKKTGYFSFSIEQNPVARFVKNKNMKQLELSEAVLRDTFHVDNPPASWWQPQALQTETWFTGEDQQRQLHLTYNPKTRRCILVIETVVSAY